jgi:hypothetical protein
MINLSSVKILAMSVETDPVSFWLAAAGRYPLLPPSQHLRLARIIQDPKVSEARRKRAIDKVVKHNLKLIPNIVKGFTKGVVSYSYGDVHTADLLQQGVLVFAVRQRSMTRHWVIPSAPMQRHGSSSLFQGTLTPTFHQYVFLRTPFVNISGRSRIKAATCLPKIKGTTRERVEACHLALYCNSLDVAVNDDGEKIDRHEAIPSKVYKTPHSSISFEEIIAGAEITDEQKQLLWMRYMEGSSHHQICKETGRSNQFVRMHLKKALAAITNKQQIQ